MRLQQTAGHRQTQRVPPTFRVRKCPESRWICRATRSFVTLSLGSRFSIPESFSSPSCGPGSSLFYPRADEERGPPLSLRVHLLSPFSHRLGGLRDERRARFSSSFSRPRPRRCLGPPPRPHQLRLCRIPRQAHAPPSEYCTGGLELLCSPSQDG